MSEKHESETDLEPDDDLSDDSTRWTCRDCRALVALGNGLSVPRHGLCHVCASSRVDEINGQLAETTAERDALKAEVRRLEGRLDETVRRQTAFNQALDDRDRAIAKACVAEREAINERDTLKQRVEELEASDGGHASLCTCKACMPEKYR